MIKCPSCEHENVDGTTFCEMCGEELQGTASAPAATAAAPDTASGNDIKCPACENLNPPENVACEVCGTDLRSPSDEEEESAAPAATADVTAAPAPASTAADTTPPPVNDTPDTSSLIVADTGADADTAVAGSDAAAAPAAGGSLAPGQVKLTVEQGMTVGKQFVLGDVEMLVGREDEDEEIYPDIDLGDQDEGYVHRKHATLKFENGQLFVTHLGGANKSRLNNKPVADNVPQPVHIGDKIAFGKVVLRVQQA